MKQPADSKRKVLLLDWRFSLSRLLDGIFQRGRFGGSQPEAVGTVQIKLRLYPLPAGHVRRIRASASVERIGMLLSGRDVVLVAKTKLGMKPGDVVSVPDGSSLRLHNRSRSRTPLLYHYAGEYPGIRGTWPFRGKRMLMVLHCLSNLVSFVDGLLTLGLERGAALVLLKDYPYPQKNEISHWLTEKGVMVGKVEDVDELVARMRDDNDPRPFVIIEDGGYFAPRFLLEPAFASRTLGAVEQTTKGKRRLKEALENLAKNGKQPAFPILSLPDSTIKQKFEPDHIARAVIKSIDSMIPDYLEGMPVALFGCGTIGSRIAEELAAMGAKVRVYDPELVDDPRATMLSYDVAATPEEAVRDAKLIIGSAGECTIKQEVIGLLARSPHRVCYLASASSERVEIVEYLEKIKLESKPFTHDYMVIGQGARLRLGTRYLLPANHEIILLADGLPVNFLGLAGMKDRAADLIMSLLFLGAVQVANGFYAQTRGLLPKAMDEIATQFHVGKTFVQYLRGGRK